ncbi:MAG: beta-propeller fold lactonase family protein [Verrucomicrobiota bacterium]|nr:beta-propeller fold lactonase family protein [Verrucomicrobiota bacterium]
MKRMVGPNNRASGWLLGRIADRLGWVLIAVCAMGSSSALETVVDGLGVRPGLRTPVDNLYKSPIQMALAPDGGTLYVVCERSRELLRVDLETRSVTAGLGLGRYPFQVLVGADGKQLFVSNREDDRVSVIDARAMEVTHTLVTGGDPHGLALSEGLGHLIVANMQSDDISIIDLDAKSEVKRIMAGHQPFAIASDPEGRFVYVTNQLTNPVPFREAPSCEITRIDTRTLLVEGRTDIVGGCVAQGASVTPDGQWVLIAVEIPKNLIPETQIYQGWMVTYAIAVMEARPNGRIGVILLDELDFYYADPFDVVCSPDGRRLYISSSGVDMVSVLDFDRVKEVLKVNTDRIGADAEELETIARHLGLSSEYAVARIPTGKNPKDLVLSEDGSTLYVAQRLSDSIGIIDTERLEMVGEIDLGGPDEVTLLRRGEYLFNYAEISFQKQLSCNTCHPENHVDGLIYDIAVDGGLGGNLVDNRTVRGITFTDPFKWSGKNPDLARQEGPRAAQLFFRSHGFEGPDRDAMVAFIESIPLPANRHVPADGTLTPAQQRGKVVFERAYTNDGRYIPIGNRCLTCHEPPYYTNRSLCDVGTRAHFDTEGTFDTPQLNNVAESGPFLHDGRCWSLEEIWTLYNPFDLHGAANDLTKQQLNDLIQYLKTF